MTSSFLDYLRNKSLISLQQFEFITEYVQTVTPKYTLFAIHFFDFTPEQIDKVNEYLLASASEFPSMPFELAASKLNLLDKEQTDFFTQHKDDVDYAHSQLLVDLNLLDLKTVCEELQFYKIESSHSENLIDMPKRTDKFTDAFLDQYVQIVGSRIKKYFDEDAIACHIEIINEVACDVFVCQELLGDQNLTTGLVFDYGLMSSSDFRFFNTVDDSQSVDTEDFVDYMCEFLNNTNGTCTYLFSTEFDLAVPMYLEKIVVQSPLIYSIDFAFSSKIIKLLVIPASDYYFIQKEMN